MGTSVTWHQDFSFTNIMGGINHLTSGLLIYKHHGGHQSPDIRTSHLQTSWGASITWYQDFSFTNIMGGINHLRSGLSIYTYLLSYISDNQSCHIIYMYIWTCFHKIIKNKSQSYYFNLQDTYSKWHGTVLTHFPSTVALKMHLHSTGTSWSQHVYVYASETYHWGMVSGLVTE